MVSATATPAAPRRIRLGMVGGGQGAFIGAVHRMAARLDDRFELVAGCLSGDPQRARASAAELGLDPDRSYDDFESMARREARLARGIEAVAIVTPNHLHAPVARAFLRRGIHVICDKPLTTSLREARRLRELVARSGCVFVLTHNYTAYPMIRQARAMVAEGALGAIRVVQVEYAQDWLATPLERTGHKQAEWRTDPARAGPAGCIGDIGTHAANLACFVTGLSIEAVAADLQTFVAGRALDDNAHLLLRLSGGARGMLWASQVAPGNANGLRLRVYGEKAGLEWAQEEPELLRFSPLGEPPRTIRRAGPGTHPAAARVSRIPAGHPEGYLEGFATLYREAAELILARLEGREPDRARGPLPGIEEGVAGVAFIEAVVESARRGGRWVGLAR
ncbi:MAG: Gfo/Idh/MocA family oxidoreductase [Geminicoccaceae bacterium]|nr:Gfo/Idh/MocA family oxidoreductase [Geminicoccaceae bacterium]